MTNDAAASVCVILLRARPAPGFEDSVARCARWIAPPTQPLVHDGPRLAAGEHRLAGSVPVGQFRWSRCRNCTGEDHLQLRGLTARIIARKLDEFKGVEAPARAAAPGVRRGSFPKPPRGAPSGPIIA